MAVSKPSDTLQDLFDDQLYTSAKSAADPKTEGLSEKIDKERDALRVTVVHRVEAREGVVRAEARRDFMFKALDAAKETAAEAEKALLAQEERCCVVMRETHGNIEARMPEDRARVESDFRKRPRASGRKTKTGETRTKTGESAPVPA